MEHFINEIKGITSIKSTYFGYETYEYIRSFDFTYYFTREIQGSDIFKKAMTSTNQIKYVWIDGSNKLFVSSKIFFRWNKLL